MLWGCCGKQVVRRSRRRTSGGTRTLAWVSRPLLKLSVAPTLVRLSSWFRIALINADYSLMRLDKKCPFTGDVSIRGRILTGRVVSTKMTRTIVIRRDYLHYIPKYSA